MSIYIVDDVKALGVNDANSLVNDADSIVKSADRCFNYGDGCFTTMYVNHGKPELFDAHLSRLQDSCKRLFIEKIPFDQLRDTLNHYCARFDTPTVVKVLISRGIGGRGYQPPSGERSQAQVYISHAHYPQHYQGWYSDGVSLALSPVKLGINPLLAGLKHCNRLEQVMIKQAMSTDVDDVVVVDANNHVVECSASNIFWFKQGIWYTPSLAGSGVAGVMRQKVIEVIKAGEYPIEFVDVGLTTLFIAEAVVTCNALTGPIAVRQIDFGTEQIRRQGQSTNVIEYNKALADELVTAVSQQLLSRFDVD